MIGKMIIGGFIGIIVGFFLGLFLTIGSCSNVFVCFLSIFSIPFWAILGGLAGFVLTPVVFWVRGGE